VVFLWRKTAPGSLVPLLATLTLNGPMRSAFGEGSRAAATAAWKAANPARGFLPGVPLGCFGVRDRDQIVSPGPSSDPERPGPREALSGSPTLA
jgi:hypothetical protein